MAAHYPPNGYNTFVPSFGVGDQTPLTEDELSPEQKAERDACASRGIKVTFTQMGISYGRMEDADYGGRQVVRIPPGEPGEWTEVAGEEQGETIFLRHTDGRTVRIHRNGVLIEEKLRTHHRGQPIRTVPKDEPIPAEAKA